MEHQKNNQVKFFCTECNNYTEKIKEMEKEICHLKGKIEILEMVDKKIEKIEKIAENMNNYTPLLDYMQDVTQKVYNLLPSRFQQSLPNPSDYTNNTKMLE